MELAQCAHFVTPDGVRGRLPILCPTHMQGCAIKIDLRPFEVAKLGSSQPMSICQWRETGALGMYGRGSRVQAQRGLHARSSVAGAGYACSARPDLHTVCRSFHKISSALSAKVRGGSRSAKILIQSRGACEARSVGGLSGAPFIATIGGHLIEPQNGAARIHSGRLSWRHPTNATPGATDAFDRLHVEFSNTSSRPIWLLALTSCRGTGLPLCPCRVSITAPCSAMMAA